MLVPSVVACVGWVDAWLSLFHGMHVELLAYPAYFASGGLVCSCYCSFLPLGNHAAAWLLVLNSVVFICDAPPCAQLCSQASWSCCYAVPGWLTGPRWMCAWWYAFVLGCRACVMLINVQLVQLPVCFSLSKKLTCLRLW
jgi:hypothetical protein